MTSFKAKYDSTCAHCQKAIAVGDPVKWDRTKRGIIYHEGCAAPTTMGMEIKPAASGDGTNALTALAQALSPMLTPSIDKNAVLDLITAEIEKRVAPTITVNVVRADRTEIKLANAHQLLPKLLKLIAMGRNIYLWGAPGSGKSTAAQQCAQALSLEWGYTALNLQTPESRLIGYMDAKGSYVRTLFRDRYEQGGVFCIDEMDNASAGLMTTLNSGLENGHMAFPDAVVPRHKDFVLVATGNTNGRGGNAMFPERRPFDSAFSERFAFLRWDYDAALEKALTLGVNKEAGGWLAWVRQVRSYCASAFPRLLVSPRAAITGALLLGEGSFTPAEIAEMLIFKGADPDTVDKVCAACPLEV